VAIKTHGFSGREIAKLFIAVQYAMYLAADSELTLDLFQSTVAIKIKDHLMKVSGFVSTINSNSHTTIISSEGAKD
jgi:hypothetical protein